MITKWRSREIPEIHSQYYCLIEPNNSAEGRNASKTSPEQNGRPTEAANIQATDERSSGDKSDGAVPVDVYDNDPGLGSTYTSLRETHTILALCRFGCSLCAVFLTCSSARLVEEVARNPSIQSTWEPKSEAGSPRAEQLTIVAINIFDISGHRASFGPDLCETVERKLFYGIHALVIVAITLA
ncbi:unnamed protein product [Leptosia nina]|uniref:Uncharacterized protein n=1 Tax=Leptosia nina TaxID=320188 RepID=A0AAV1K3W9_9NEOP